MISNGNSLVDILKQNNVGGVIALPPIGCLGAVHSSDYVAARVEVTGRDKKRRYPGAGLTGWTAEIHCICPQERLL